MNFVHSWREGSFPTMHKVDGSLVGSKALISFNVHKSSGPDGNSLIVLKICAQNFKIYQRNCKISRSVVIDGRR